MSTMPYQTMVGWAKEELVSAMDAHIREIDDTSAVHNIEPDDLDELRKQRNRVAKMFGLPEV